MTTSGATSSSRRSDSVLERSRGASRRARKDRIMHAVLIMSVLLALIPLAMILTEVVRRGITAMDWSFLTSEQPFSQRREGGGYVHGLVGTLYMVGIAGALAIPLGIASATFIVEYPESKLRPFVQFFTDVMTGVPSIFVGLFIYSLLVRGSVGISIGFSTLAGALALALLMLPIVTRSSEEIIRLVPDELRNGAYGLGARRWQVVMKVVLPASASGLITSGMLAVARAAGETAPLLLTALGAFTIVPELTGSPQSALPLLIYGEARGPYAAAHARAWAGALELMLLVLLLTFIARTISRRRSVSAR